MPGVFIGYRRGDVAGHAGRLYDRLAAHFGPDWVFMDVQSIDKGESFETRIKRTITGCDVVLALVGPRWAAERLSDPDDFVRLELSVARDLETPVIPVLVDDAPLPQASALPEPLAWFPGLQAADLHHKEFDQDVSTLIAQLSKRIKAPPTVARERLRDAMTAAGWPHSWAAALLRGFGVREIAWRLCPLAVPLLLFLVLVALPLGTWLWTERLSRQEDLEEARQEGYIKGAGQIQRFRIAVERPGSEAASWVSMPSPTIKFVNSCSQSPTVLSEDVGDSKGIYDVDIAKHKISQASFPLKVRIEWPHEKSYCVSTQLSDLFVYRIRVE
jgi:hypothetical protein